MLRKFDEIKWISQSLSRWILKMTKKLSEKEIDQKVVAQADDENAWTNLKKRTKRASREKFLQALSRVPNVEP